LAEPTVSSEGSSSSSVRLRFTRRELFDFDLDRLPGVLSLFWFSRRTKSALRSELSIASLCARHSSFSSLTLRRSNFALEGIRGNCDITQRVVLFVCVCMYVYI